MGASAHWFTVWEEAGVAILEGGGWGVLCHLAGRALWGEMGILCRLAGRALWGEMGVLYHLAGRALRGEISSVGKRGLVVQSIRGVL